MPALAAFAQQLKTYVKATYFNAKRCFDSTPLNVLIGNRHPCRAL